MNDDFEQRHPAAVQSIRRHQFVSLIAGSIAISLFLVYVALSLYQSSGTLQLDLSRPGYDAARQEATRDNEVFEGFSANGPIDQESLDEFEKLYAEKAKDATSLDAFSGDALSDHTLLLDK
jgi:hypothetical protein